LEDNAVTTREKRLTSLDAVRGIAACVVVLSHLFLILPDDQRSTFVAKLTYPLRNGTVAVFIFFVLSGYVLSLPYLRGAPLSYPRFVIRRLCRIYLPFAAAILFSLILYGISGQPHTASHWFSNWPEAWPDVPTLAGHFFMLGTDPDIRLDSVMWTLVHEMRISLMFPLLIMLCRDTRVAISSALALSVASTKALAMCGQPHPVLVESFLMTWVWTAQMIPYFITGILLSKHSVPIDDIWQRMPGLLRFAAFIFVLMGYAIKGDYLRIWSNVTLGMVAALTVILAIEAPRLRKLLDEPIPQWLGRISYSLYLIHLPLMFALFTILTRHLPFYVVMLIVAGTAALAATLMHQIIEVPAISLGHRLTRRGVNALRGIVTVTGPGSRPGSGQD
jgi:peptidoglycan/LPS O-acetylase OafA/YrhL